MLNREREREREREIIIIIIFTYTKIYKTCTFLSYWSTVKPVYNGQPGTPSKWPLFRGGHYSQDFSKNEFIKLAQNCNAP